MANEYKLSFTGTEINNKLNKIEDLEIAVSTKADKATSISNITNYNAQQKVQSTRLVGMSKLNDISRYIVQTENAESTIKVDGNESTVEHLSLSNEHNYDNKVGIDVVAGQRLSFYDIYINSNYAIGMRIPFAWYDQFMSCWIQGKEYGVIIGNPNLPYDWCGVLDFNACHINNSKTGVMIYAKETNTICFDKCSFEGTDLAFENYGTMYARGTYVGDQENNGNYIGVLKAHGGSRSYFNDCTLGISSHANGGRSSIFALQHDATDGHSEVHVQGGTLGLSNNFNLSGSVSTIYDSDHKNNLIYLDFVRHIQPTTNLNHCRTPYYIYDGYSPLRSKHPIPNYVSNGTMKSVIGNSLMLDKNSKLTLDANMTNPFGGSVLRANGATKYFYRVPKKLVGKPMTLELYLYTPTTSGFNLSSAELGINSWNETMHKYETERKPCMYRIDVIPTAESGSITLNLNADYVVYGVILKEARFKEFLSCYEDSDRIYNDVMPLTTNASKGDFVYDISNGYDWEFDGEKWKSTEQVTYKLEGSNGVVTLLGSDGSRSTISIVATKAIAYKLTHCMSTNNVTEVAADTTYTTVLVADANYRLSTVKVMMGGVDVTADVYDSATGKITILAVTGAVVITAVAEFITWDVTVENFAIAPRQVIEWNVSTINVAASNEKMILATSTKNECSFSTRDNRTLYLIPIPSGAKRVTVSTTDNKVISAQFLGLNYSASGGYTKVFDTGAKSAMSYNFTENSAQYIAISLAYSASNNVDWSYDASQATVTFSNY